MNKKYCDACGAEIEEGASCCSECAKEITQSDKKESEAENKTKKKSGKALKNTLLTIIIFIVVIILASVVKTGIVKIASGIEEKKALKEIETFIESTSDYIPGECTEEGYSSEFWNLLFKPEENWIMYTDEQLEASNKSVRESALKSSGIKDNPDISDELKSKWEESVYAATEMGAFYVVDEYIKGSVVLNVSSTYNADETTIADMAAGMEKSINAAGKVTKSQESEFYGNKCHIVSGVVGKEGSEQNVTFIVLKKDEFMASIICNYIDKDDFMETLPFSAFNG